ncbi:MAG TPA: hypothetical protein VFW59_01390 [Gallionella sp.]|nr:hypothetical protein [Gallionella sp.]
MDNKSIFVKTDKGEDEIRSRTPHLSGDIKRALLMVDGKASLDELSKRAAPSMREMLQPLFVELESAGFIQNKAKVGKPHEAHKSANAPASGHAPKLSVPAGMVVPAKKPVSTNLEELDFTAAYRVPSPAVLAAEAAKADAERLKKEIEIRAREEAEANARKEIEAAKQKAQQEAEAARIRAEQEAAKVRKEAELVKMKAQQDAEAARLKAEQEAAKAREEAEAAKRKAATEARAREQAEHQAREQAEAARLKAEQEAAQVRAELAAAKAQAEADARAHAEAEARARKEIEIAKLKAQEEAEAARLKAERAAAKAHEEAEQAKRQAAAAQAKVAAEAKAREEAEYKAREQAEAARQKAEQEAAQAREEAELAKRQAAEIQAKIEAEARMRQEIEAAKLKAQQEAEAARIKAEEDAEKARAEAAEQKAQAEAARLKAEQDAEKVRAEAAEQKARAEAERIKAEQDAAKMRAETEAANLKARQEAEAVRIKAQQEAEALRVKAEQEAEANAPARKFEGGTAKRASSVSVTVLFFDVVGYTKQPVNKQIKIKKQFNQLVSDCLGTLEEAERIILDTGDGAAIGFLHHPEDALQVARQFREAVTAHRHTDYPELNVRTGIHLGPINIVKDMNGQSNMVGDGINDAQRVMSFAGVDQIFISRPYYDFISRLSDEYANLFQSRGIKQDKHGREHAVYELVDISEADVIAPVSQPVTAPIKLEPFVFAAPEIGTAPIQPVTPEEEHTQTSTLLGDAMAGAESKLPETNSGQVPPAPTKVEQAPPAKEEPKPVAKAHMPTEEEVATIAAAQAKVWSEAEQRAAKASEERAAQAAQPVPPVEVPKVKARRKPIPWGKVAVGLCVLMVVAVFVVPLVLPMQERAAKLEQMLATQFKQPVHIGKMSGRLLPTPRLELSDVSIGETKQIRMKSARMDFSLSALFSSTKAINTLGLEGVQVDGAVLQQLPPWLQQLAGNAQYPVAQVELSQVSLETEGLKLSGIGGLVSFDAAGKFVQAKLHANEDKYALEINAAPQDKLKVTISVRNSAPPLLAGWVFEDLRANGELTRDELIISDLDASTMDGRLLGDARLSWGAGWHATGNLVAKAITLQKISNTLSGDMDGSARFRMQADSLGKLPDSSVLEGSFVATKGIINGFDLVETARLRSKDSQPGGRSHFDELRGELTVDKGRYRFSQLRMTAGVLSASGTVDMEKQQLSGRITAELALRTGMGSVGLQVGGTVDNPSLHAR